MLRVVELSNGSFSCPATAYTAAPMRCQSLLSRMAARTAASTFCSVWGRITPETSRCDFTLWLFSLRCPLCADTYQHERGTNS